VPGRLRGQGAGGLPAAAQDDQGDQPGLADQFERSLPVGGADQLQRTGIETRPGDRWGNDMVEERRGGPQRGSASAQHPRVAGLQQL